MAYHVHLSVIDLLKTFAYVLIAGTFWRLLTLRLRQTPAGQAMALAY
jgi:hypothetical protein